jgi:phosphatidate cytidylyltransferase
MPLLMGVIWLDSSPLAAAAFGVVVVLAGLEWASLQGWGSGTRASFGMTIALLCGVAGLGLSRLAPWQLVLQGLACLGWLAACVAVAAGQRGHNLLPSGRLPLALIGMLALLPAYLSLLWIIELDRLLLAGLFALIWTADTAAFFAGRAWGRRRLASRISPGKTWAGALAAVGSAPLVGIVISRLPTEHEFSMAYMSVISVLVVIASIVGDLFESLVKRRGGFKDSGTLLPGHGGVLDRIDSLLSAAPVFATALLLTVHAR